MSAPTPADTAARVLEHLQGRREAMVDLLRRLTEIESPTREPETQARIQDVLAERLRGAGFRTRRIPGRETGGHLFGRPRGRGCPFQLVLGHSDTVWPLGTLEEMPIERDGDRLRGPGVFDMKAGLVQMIHALETVRELELDLEVAPAVLINSDEEIGSPESERWVRRLARRAERALVLEPALGPHGRIKTARKGTGHFEIRIVGRSSHAGLDPEDGASAIQELSHVIQALHDLTDAENGVSVNVGEIFGGVRPNVVAPSARAVVDVRVPDRERARSIEEAIRSLEARTPGTRLEIEGSMGREPMERTPRNRRLWEEARRLGELLELEMEEGTSGGASDANLTSALTATLDGLGPVGGGAHADHEHVEIDEMPRRAALLALLLTLPPAGAGTEAPGDRPGPQAASAAEVDAGPSGERSHG